MKAATRQAPLPFKTRGGKRKGAGRPRVHADARLRHEARPAMDSRSAAHISMRVIEDVGYLRGYEKFRVVRRAIAGAQRSWFRIVHFSLQSNHLHLVTEADDGRSMWRGLRSLQVAMARGLNKVLARSGRVFVDRYHQEVIRSPRQMRAVLAYVLNNARRHGERESRRPGWVDPFSSAECFDGWRGRTWSAPARAAPLDEPAARRRQMGALGPGVAECVQGARGWLASKGWRKAGVIDLEHIPGPATARRATGRERR